MRDILEEFNSIEIDDDIDFSYTKEYLKVIVENLIEQRRVATATISKLQLIKVEAFILRKLGFSYCPGYYQDHIEILNRHVDLCDQFFEYDCLLKKVLTDENYQEVYKLTHLLDIKYCSNFEHLIECKNKVEAFYNRTSFSSNTDDDTKEVDCFMREKISNLKGYQKIKKKAKK